MSLADQTMALMDPAWGQSTKEAEREWAFSSMQALMEIAPDPESHVSIAAFLSALQVRGAKGPHLAGFADALRSLGRQIDFGEPRLVDTCGTGGGVPSLNLSTGSALLAASAGAKIAKHGNRGVTSSFGSADALEALGVTITPDEGKLQECMKRTGFAFLFAPHFFPAVGQVRPVRTKIGIRTVFNQLGPLLNPARATLQIVGVFQDSLLEPTADALAHLQAEEAWVVRGLEGMDELSPSGPSRVARVLKGKVVAQEVWDPSDHGLTSAPTEGWAPAGSPGEAVRRIMTGLTDPSSPEFAALLPTAAVTLSLGLQLSLGEAADLARRAASERRGEKLVADLREVTG